MPIINIFFLILERKYFLSDIGKKLNFLSDIGKKLQFLSDIGKKMNFFPILERNQRRTWKPSKGQIICSVTKFGPRQIFVRGSNFGRGTNFEAWLSAFWPVTKFETGHFVFEVLEVLHKVPASHKNWAAPKFCDWPTVADNQDFFKSHKNWARHKIWARPKFCAVADDLALICEWPIMRGWDFENSSRETSL